MKLSRFLPVLFLGLFAQTVSAQVVSEEAMGDRLKISCRSGNSAQREMIVPLFSNSTHTATIFRPLTVGSRSVIANFEATLQPDGRLRLGQAALYTTIRSGNFEELGESYFVGGGGGTAEQSLFLVSGAPITVGKTRLIIDSSELVACTFTPTFGEN